MTAISISMTIKIGTMVAIFMASYFIITSYVNESKNVSYYEKFQQIAEYFEAKLEQGISTANAQKTEAQLLLELPMLETDYTLDISCGDYFTINITSKMSSRSYKILESFNCSQVSASDITYPGNRCLTVSRTNQTNYNISLGDECAY